MARVATQSHAEWQSPHHGCSHADGRVIRITGPVGHVQHVLHRTDRRGILLRRNTPHLLPTQLQLVFLSARRTVSRDIDSTISSSTSRSASSFNVQWDHPGGRSEQQIATNFASLSRSRMVWVGDCPRFFRSNADSKPSSTHRCRTCSIVRVVTANAAAICSSVQQGPLPTHLLGAGYDRSWACARPPCPS